MKNYKIVISYDGNTFHGFQKQPKDFTVQEALEAALDKLLTSYQLTYAGRTDTGVHAKQQVLSITTSDLLKDSFKESLKDFFPHASYFAMGVDATDINNDGSMDLFVGEMLAEDNKRQKTNMAPMDMERFAILASNNMYYQYMRNSFFINSGNGHFSDVANYAGVDQTDWSWSVLFGDYDLDTDDDLLVANGWLKDIEASRLKDDIRNANDYLILEAAANTDSTAKAQFTIAKDATEKYKDPIKKYFNKELSVDSTLVALHAIYPIKEVNAKKVKAATLYFTMFFPN